MRGLKRSDTIVQGAVSSPRGMLSSYEPSNGLLGCQKSMR